VRDDEPRALVLGFDLTRSDLPLTLAFPQLVYNMVRWGRADAVGAPAPAAVLSEEGVPVRGPVTLRRLDAPGEWSIPAGKRRVTSDWWFGGSVGYIPYQYVKHKCTPAAEGVGCADPGVTPEGASETMGISLDLFGLNAQWLTNDRRMAIEFGPAIQLDVLPPGTHVYTRFNDDVTQPDTAQDNVNYAWTPRFQAGALVGLRFAPPPRHLYRKRSKSFPWGAPLPDGSTHLGRLQYGIRGGFLLGPTYDGLEGTGLFETWVNWSVRNKNSRQSTFTPYYPAILIGPYFRGQVGFLLSGKEQNPLRLAYSLSAIVGLRVQLRLTAPPAPPEAPEL